jgi:methionine sulfoxide reductase heme-binding subunit
MSQGAPGNYAWWLAGRSAGIVAMLLITCAVILGLAMAARVLPTRWRRDAARLHQYLSLLSLAAIAAHGALLAADPWLKAGVAGITVPFMLSYRPLWTGLGILGGYLAAVLALSFYARRRIGTRTWRRMHRLTLLAYALSLAHVLGSGTDSSIPLVRDAILASSIPVVFLFALRAAGGARRTGPGRPAAAGAGKQPPAGARPQTAEPVARASGRTAQDESRAPVRAGAHGARLTPPRRLASGPTQAG